MKAIKQILITLVLLLSFPIASGISVNSPVTFNNDKLGLYTSDDFKKDWNMSPTASSGQGSRLRIVKDNNSNKNVLEVTYLARQIGGSSAMTFTPSIGGKYRTLFFQYKVKFASGFKWVKGGKLPGLTSAPDSPTGCIKNGTFDGFSARLMWRETGRATSYIYNPTKVEECGDYYYYQPAVYFKTNQWYTLTQEVYLNDPGEYNGYIRQWVNGVLVLDLTGMLLRESTNIGIDRIKMDTFFGGSTMDWAPSSKQRAYFDDFIVTETKPALR